MDRCHAKPNSPRCNASARTGMVDFGGALNKNVKMMKVIVKILQI